MQVTSGATWTVNSSTGAKRSYSVTISEDDLRSMGVKVDDLTPAVLWKYLNHRADSLVVVYMQQQGAISKEFAEQRLAELKAGLA